MLGAATLAAGGAGWLLGPFVGEGIFRVVYRKEWGGMAAVRCDSFFSFCGSFSLEKINSGRERNDELGMYSVSD